MTQLMTDPTMQVFAVCAALLVLKMWLTGTATGVTRIVPGPVNPSPVCRAGGHFFARQGAGSVA